VSNLLIIVGDKVQCGLIFENLNDCDEKKRTNIGNGQELIIVTKDGIEPLVNGESGLFLRGFIIDHESRRITLGINGINEDEVGDVSKWHKALEGAFAALSWDSDSVSVRNDLFGLHTLTYFQTEGLLVCSDSLLALSWVRKILNLANQMDREVAESKSWVYSLGHSPLSEDLIINECKRLCPGQHLVFDRLSGFTTLHRSDIRDLFREKGKISYAENLRNCGQRIRDVICSFLQDDSFTIQLGLSGGLDSRCILACIPENLRKSRSLMVLTNVQSSRSADFEVVKIISENQGIELNPKAELTTKQHEMGLKIVNMSDRINVWMTSSLGIHDMMYIPKNYWNHPGIVELGGHGGEICKGAHAWRTAHKMIKKVKRINRESVQQVLYRGLKQAGIKPKSPDSLQLHHLLHTASVHNSRFMTRNMIALRPLMNWHLIALSINKVNPHPYRGSKSYSILHDLLILADEKLAEIPFNKGRKQLNKKLISESKERLGNQRLDPPNLYELRGKVSCMNNGPAKSLIALAHTMTETDEQVEDLIEYLVDKASKMISDDPLYALYQHHSDIYKEKSTEPGSYLPDTGIHAAKICSLLLCDPL